MKISKLTSFGIKIEKNKLNRNATASFYSLQATTNTSKEIQFEKYRNKKILFYITKA